MASASEESEEWISQWDYARIPPSPSTTNVMATRRRAEHSRTTQSPYTMIGTDSDMMAVDNDYDYDYNYNSNHTDNGVDAIDADSVSRTSVMDAVDTDTRTASSPSVNPHANTNDMAMSWSRMKPRTSNSNNSNSNSNSSNSNSNSHHHDDRTMDDSQTDSTAALTQTASLDDGSSFLFGEDTTDRDYTDYTDYHDDDDDNVSVINGNMRNLDSHQDNIHDTNTAFSNFVPVRHHSLAPRGQQDRIEPHASSHQQKQEDACPFMMMTMMDENEGLLGPIMDDITSVTPMDTPRYASTLAPTATEQSDRHIDASASTDLLLRDLVDPNEHQNNDNRILEHPATRSQESGPIVAFPDAAHEASRGFRFHPMPQADTASPLPTEASRTIGEHPIASPAQPSTPRSSKTKPRPRPVPYITGPPNHHVPSSLRSRPSPTVPAPSQRTRQRSSAKNYPKSSTAARHGGYDKQPIKHLAKTPTTTSSPSSRAVPGSVGRSITSKKRQHYEGMLRKLTESMKRSQSTRKSLELVQEEIKDYSRKANLKRVLQSIEASSRQIDSHFVHKRSSKKLAHSKSS